MAIKSIDKILTPPPPHMVGDGFRVHSFLPGDGRLGKMRMSPFFLLDYGSLVEFPPTDTPRGVGVHPHRGFETVTIAYRGRIAHHDSAGHHGIIGEGDVQWMTAASGLLHKEYHEESFSKKGGPFQMVQIWVNLPAKHKMDPPAYQEITNERMGKFHLPDGKGIVEVIAGNFQGTKGPARTFTPIEMYNLKLQAGAQVELDLPVNHNTALLLIEGSATIQSNTVPADHFVLFNSDGERIQVEAKQDSVILVLSGEPIQEPIAAYGPFLMNSWAEIEQAIQDFNAGKFGVLED
ncbi:MAG: pirin family protein [Bacteroidota bacterium]